VTYIWVGEKPRAHQRAIDPPLILEVSNIRKQRAPRDSGNISVCRSCASAQRSFETSYLLGWTLKRMLTALSVLKETYTIYHIVSEKQAMKQLTGSAIIITRSRNDLWHRKFALDI
jgi:hypothetical protein